MGIAGPNARRRLTDDEHAAFKKSIRASLHSFAVGIAQRKRGLTSTWKQRKSRATDRKHTELMHLELALALRSAADELVHDAVRAAREADASWAEIADVTGHGSRGAAARYFSEVRVSKSET